jgi:hypothetical protein
VYALPAEAWGRKTELSRDYSLAELKRLRSTNLSSTGGCDEFPEAPITTNPVIRPGLELPLDPERIWHSGTGTRPPKQLQSLLKSNNREERKWKK